MAACRICVARSSALAAPSMLSSVLIASTRFFSNCASMRVHSSGGIGGPATLSAAMCLQREYSRVSSNVSWLMSFPFGPPMKFHPHVSST